MKRAFIVLATIMLFLPAMRGFAQTNQATEAPTTLEGWAERVQKFGKGIPQEQVFIHMDNTCYFLGDTIYFKAYVRRSDTGAPSRLSGLLYAELFNQDGYLVERQNIELKNGQGNGSFCLLDTLYGGYYELRAYTRWQLNWGQTEHYHAWPTEYWFYNKAMAKDFFRDYEKLYSRVFPVYDKPKKEGDFYRDMTLRPLRRYFKTAPKPAELRLSLFPEGGNLVAGVPCRVAFEAATSEGEVKEGTLFLQIKNEKIKIKNERGEEVESVQTENRGRGTFIFTPEEGKKYEVVFTAHEPGKDGKRETISQEIKDVKAEGVALQVRRDSLTGDWSFTIHASGVAAQQPLGITVMHEGRLQFFEQTQPQPKAPSQIHFTLPLQGERGGGPGLPSGIHQVTVFDSIGHIYADRLFFITRPELTQPTLMLSGLKEQYQPYEPVELDITSAHLMPDQTISLAVRDAALQDYTFDSGNILTEMLLASEIKGFVPQPEYFFEADDAEHRRALDLLMMTQGWRRFNWQDMAVKGSWEITHPAEHTQMVTGTVNRYWLNNLERADAYTKVQADHDRFMSEWSAPLSEQQSSPLFDADGQPTALSPQGVELRGPAFRNMAWNLNPIYERRNAIGAIADTRHGVFSQQGLNWNNTDYNFLSYRAASDYRRHQKEHNRLAARHYLETGTVKKDVRVHAEFIDPLDQTNYLTGETSTTKGRFQIDLPRFEGQCVFFLGASDTTKWHKKWDGQKKRQPHHWVQLDNQTEYDELAGRLTKNFPEFYVRLNFPYPRWVKPYTFYQVHNAPRQDGVHGSFHATNPASSKRRLLTDGTSLLNEVTIRASHSGLRRVDYSKPAYVIDAYEAANLAMDAGLIDNLFSVYAIGDGAARALIGDMAMYRHYDMTFSEDSRYKLERGPLDRMRYNLLTFIDKFHIYTDYSPRREGDQRYEQSNQPEVRVDIHRYADDSRRVTYRDRRYILQGFAYQEDFYHPDYQRRPPTEATKDYRRTLYWNPELKLDANGRAHVRLFTGTRPASLNVSASGQTADGALLFNQ